MAAKSPHVLHPTPLLALTALTALALLPLLASGARLLPIIDPPKTDSPADINVEDPKFFDVHATIPEADVAAGEVFSGGDFYKKHPDALVGPAGTGPGSTDPPVSPAKFADALYIPPVIDASSGPDLKIGMYVTYQKFHRDLPPTKVYAYGTSKETAAFPGPTIQALRNVTFTVTWENWIDDYCHMFAVDRTIPTANPPHGGVPAVVHRHGGEQQSTYDGSPGSWYTFFNDTGPTFVTNKYIYPNNQEAAALWYHDHTIGLTSLNVAAGLAGAYILRDPPHEDPLHLPSGEFEVPLLLADRSFFPNGSINYPNVGDNPAIHPIWIPEYFGTTNTVNGKVWPFFEAKKTAYRFRIVNGANARAYNLKFICAAAEDYPSFNLPLKGTPLKFNMVASDGGYLNSPVELDQVLIAVAQRADIVIDFAKYSWCNDVIVINDAPAPFPGGDLPDADSGVVMKIVLKGDPTNPISLPSTLNNIEEVNVTDVFLARYISMAEVSDPVSGAPIVLLMNGLSWNDPPTETPIYGSTEVWYMINVSPDAHPMHLHLIQYRLISRQAFDPELYKSKKCSFRNPLKPSCYTGPPVAPSPRHAGWTDTVNALPGEVTAILVRIATQSGGRFPFDPTVAPGYNWHCHIVNHEDNEKMRPMIIEPVKPIQVNNRNETPLPRTIPGVTFA